MTLSKTQHGQHTGDSSNRRHTERILSVSHIYTQVYNNTSTQGFHFPHVGSVVRTSHVYGYLLIPMDSWEITLMPVESSTRLSEYALRRENNWHVINIIHHHTFHILLQCTRTPFVALHGSRPVSSFSLCH